MKSAWIIELPLPTDRTGQAPAFFQTCNKTGKGFIGQCGLITNCKYIVICLSCVFQSQSYGMGNSIFRMRVIHIIDTGSGYCLLYFLITGHQNNLIYIITILFYFNCIICHVSVHWSVMQQKQHLITAKSCAVSCCQKDNITAHAYPSISSPA